MARTEKPTPPQIYFKDPDLLFELAAARHPGDYDDPAVEKARSKFRKEYTEHTEYGDYGTFEIDPATLTGRLLPKKEWR